jgi:putative Holliday junction resolvase
MTERDVRLPQQGRLAGIDYGTVRIGVAITDPQQRLASPFESYVRRSREADASFFRRLAEQEQVVGFVVGLPVHTSGQESQKSKEARQFGQWLHEVTGRPVVFFDERYSTVRADELLAGALKGKGRKRRRDMVAAQVLLSEFLESDRRCEPPAPLED